MKILHNPRCGKSRNCIAHYENINQPFEVVKYLENPLNYNEIEDLLQKLNFSPMQLIRTKESIWIEKFKDKNLSNEQIIQAMVDYPILIERPIVIKENSAFIARDSSAYL